VPKITQYSKLENITDASFLASNNESSGKVTFVDLISNLKKELGYQVRVLEKCSHCGQWGAVMCACPHCGAPIDPKE
jgi:hypothetical protein